MVGVSTIDEVLLVAIAIHRDLLGQAQRRFAAAQGTRRLHNSQSHHARSAFFMSLTEECTKVNGRPFSMNSCGAAVK